MYTLKNQSSYLAYSPTRVKSKKYTRIEDMYISIEIRMVNLKSDIGTIKSALSFELLPFWDRKLK